MTNDRTSTINWGRYSDPVSFVRAWAAHTKGDTLPEPPPYLYKSWGQVVLRVWNRFLELADADNTGFRERLRELLPSFSIRDYSRFWSVFDEVANLIKVAATEEVATLGVWELVDAALRTFFHPRHAVTQKITSRAVDAQLLYNPRKIGDVVLPIWVNVTANIRPYRCRYRRRWSSRVLRNGLTMIAHGDSFASDWEDWPTEVAFEIVGNLYHRDPKAVPHVTDRYLEAIDQRVKKSYEITFEENSRFWNQVSL